MELESRVSSILHILSTRERTPEYRALKIKKVLPQLRRAIEKVEEKTYGYCDDCGEVIPEDRLKASPGATRCVTCQKISESSY